MPNINQQFLDFLKQTPEALKDFVGLAKKFMEVHGEIPPPQPESPDRGPREWNVGEVHELRTTGISDAELAALSEAEADADVVEKAQAFAEGFIKGVMFVA